MRIEAASLNATHHRLLEGVLLRLARANVNDFVLRGGMLLRHWFRPIPRPVGDLDLMAAFPFTVDEAARRFLPVFRDAAIADGVALDSDRVRVEGIWLDTGSPGLRVFATGEAGGVEDDFHIDITAGPPRPAPVFGVLPTACRQDAPVWMCRPETIVGQKVQALCHLGMLSWRPKDLNDLRLLLRMPLDDTELRQAIVAHLAALGGTMDVRAVFGPATWWGMKLSSARWLDFVKASPEQGVPGSLARVVAEIAERLGPILEG